MTRDDIMTEAHDDLQRHRKCLVAMHEAVARGDVRAEKFWRDMARFYTEQSR